MRLHYSQLFVVFLLLGGLLGPLRPVAAQPKRTLLQEDVGMVNALAYGATFDSVAIAAAISAIGSNPRILFLAVGTWTLGTNVSVPSNITLYVPAGATVSLNAGVILTLATIPRYDQPYWLAGAGTLLVTDRTWPIDVRVYGAVGDGVADDTASITKAITAATTADGGTVSFTCGTYRLTSQITVLNKRNLRLVGPTGGRASAITDQCVTLQYTASSGSVFHFDGVVGLELSFLSLSYTSNSFPASSSFLRLDKLNGSTATSQVHLHDMSIAGSTTSSKGALLIFLDQTSDVTIERITFANAKVAVNGPNGAASGVINVRIRDCRFESSLSDYPLKIAGWGWVVEGNRFNGLSNGAAGAAFILAQGTIGLTYQGNVHLVATTVASTSWVSSFTGPILGGTIAGNLFQDGGGSSWCIFLGTSTIGVSVVGNYLSCGTNITGGVDTLYAGNYSASPTVFGTYPTGNSVTVLPSFGAGTPTIGTGRWRLGTTGAAGGKRVVCYDATSEVGRLYVSSTGTDCSN